MTAPPPHIRTMRVSITVGDLRDAVEYLEICTPRPNPDLMQRLRAILTEAYAAPAAPQSGRGTGRDIGDNSMPPMPTPTARKMQEKAWPKSGSFREQVTMLVMRSANGMSDDDIELATGRAHQSVSACRNTLVADGWLEPLIERGVPVTRKNRYNNDAQIWVPTTKTLDRLGVARQGTLI